MLVNRLLVLIAALALLTVGMLTTQAGNAIPAAVSNVRDYSDYALRHPASLNGASDWFERHGGGSGYEDDASNSTTAVIPSRSDRYFELKEKQLEQRDAEQFGAASISGEGDSYHALQKEHQALEKEQRAMQKELRAGASGWVYHYDALTNKGYAYHYSTTPTGPVLDDLIELTAAPGMENASRNDCEIVSSPNITCWP